MGLAKRWLFPLLTLLGAALICLGFVEAALRIFHPVRMTSINLGRVRLSDNPALMYELVPAVMDHNSAGFRDREYSLAKGAGVYRVAFLGDSLTFGVDVDLDHTPPRRLEAYLNRARHSSPRIYQVLNFGVPGYSIIQEAELARIKALSYAPDMVVLQVCINDWQPYTIEFVDLLRSSRELDSSWLLGFYHPQNALLRRALYQSQLYRRYRYYRHQRWLARSGGGTGGRAAGAGDFDAPLMAYYRKHGFYQQHFGRLARMLRKRSIPLVVVLVPAAASVDPGGETYTRRLQQLRGYCGEHGSTLLDFRGYLSQAQKRDPRLSYASLFKAKDGIHLNKQGDRLLVLALAETIKQQLSAAAGRSLTPDNAAVIKLPNSSTLLSER